MKFNKITLIFLIFSLLIIYVIIRINNKKYYIGVSSIHNKGAFAKKNLKKGIIIDKLHDILNNNNYKFYELGKMYNHSNKPNCKNIKIKNTRYLMSLRNIQKDEELTADYRLQPDLEQPKNNWKL